ncbi:MAG TPA: hypothetical protein PLS49_00505 [Candidatus Woesebacteria bacterium]|nr:hypothetical protein [Candidatus Woesebacteria bacterium]
MNNLKRLFHNSFFQGSIFITAASFIGGFLNYLFNIFVGRALGPSGYGEITTLFSYLTVLSIPVNIITQFIIIKIGSKKDNVAYTAAIIDWFILYIKKYWFVAVLVLCISPFIPQITNLSPVVGYSLIPLILFTYVIGLYDGLLQGLHLFLWASIVGIIAVFIKFLGSIVVLYMWHQLGIIILFLILSSLIKGIISQIKLSQLIKSVKGKREIIHKSIKTVFTDPQVLLTSVSGAAILILSNADIMYVKKNFTAEEAGIYGSWSLFAKVILYVLGPILTVSFIFFSSKKQEKYHRFVLLGGIILLFISGFGAMMAYGLYGRELVETLFGREFFQLLPYLEWASFFGVSYTLIIFMNNYFLAKGNKAAYILAYSLPLYIAGLLLYGKTLGQVMLVNIWFSFGVLGIYFLLYVKNRIVALFS